VLLVLSTERDLVIELKCFAASIDRVRRRGKKYSLFCCNIVVPGVVAKSSQGKRMTLLHAVEDLALQHQFWQALKHGNLGLTEFIKSSLLLLSSEGLKKTSYL
jgi:hypothetical protein